ncbi:MAG: radical SAM family heme chaperone HemW [Bacteroidia bacterium]
MSGLYVHIPFCRKACTYCNFHFSTSLQNTEAMVNALLKELDLRLDDWHELAFETLYWGGGTPSVLSPEAFYRLSEGIKSRLGSRSWPEYTLEANPEDMDSERLSAWKESGVNRLSIGIQSLNDRDLHTMNRAHNSEQARLSIETALQMGFQNISVDLIYGTPWKSHEEWAEELNWVQGKQLPHLSCYALTVEEKTALAHSIRSGQAQAPNDQHAHEQFDMLQAWAESQGYEHYEISNLALPGHRAIHNSRYWNRVPYLGIGPSAHSFDGKRRSWNIANNAAYLKQADLNQWNMESEELSLANRVNETIMTKLRLMEGLAAVEIESLWPGWTASNQKFIQNQTRQGYLVDHPNQIILSAKGRFFADFITSELLVG